MGYRRLTKTIAFEEVTGRGEVSFMRIYLTDPSKDPPMVDHYFSVVPIKYADTIKELAEVMGFKIMIKDPVKG